MLEAIGIGIGMVLASVSAVVAGAAMEIIRAFLTKDRRDAILHERTFRENLKQMLS